MFVNSLKLITFQAYINRAKHESFVTISQTNKTEITYKKDHTLLLSS